MLTNCLPGLCCLVVFVAIADSCSIQSTKMYVSRGSSVDMPVNVKLPVFGEVVSYSVKLASESGNIISVGYYGSAVIGSSFAKITFTGDFSTGNLSYTIKSMNDSFIGDHEVRRSNPAALLNCTTLYILGKPTASTLVVNTNRHLIGDTITFLCTSVSTTVPSDHNLSMSYSWTVDDVTNPTDSRYTYSTSRHTLTLSNVTKGDSSKILRCTATEVVTGGLTSDTSNTYSINVLYGPDSVNLNPSSVSYTKNEGTLLSNIQCSADCNPACTYRWRKQGQTTIVSTNGSLILGLLQRSETGTYICTATNPNKVNEAQILVNVRYIPESPRLFRFMGVIGSVPQLFWVKGFNGGYKQYFAIETTLTDTDDWVEQVRIDEGDQRFYLQPMQSYIANITGLSPGHHWARLIAGNKIGKRTNSKDLTIFFNIPKGDYECPNHWVQEDDSLKAIVGGVGTAVIAVIIIAVVVVVLQRRRCNSEMANSPDIGSNICNPHGRRNPVEIRQSDGTFKNEVFEDDEPVHIGVEDTSYVNENRPTYESLLEQIPNPATYETIATNSNIQTGEMYESLGDSREQSRNYDSLTASVENATHGLMPGQYENL